MSASNGIKLACRVAKIAGSVAGCYGVYKVVDAKMKYEDIVREHQLDCDRLDLSVRAATEAAERLGRLEMEVLCGFDAFSDLFELVKGRPEFAEVKFAATHVPEPDLGELRDASLEANVALGAVGSAALGAAGGVALAFALRGVGKALVPASPDMLVTLGGRPLPLGLSVLCAGACLALYGISLSDRVDEAYRQMLEAKDAFALASDRLKAIAEAADQYEEALSKVREAYEAQMARASAIVYGEGRTGWDEFTGDERILIENLVYTVGLLYGMCKLRLTIGTEDEQSEVNPELEGGLQAAENLLDLVA